MKNLNWLDWLTLIILIIGGINWGLIAFFQYDLVSAIFGSASTASRIIYGLVGVSALYIGAISPVLEKK